MRGWKVVGVEGLRGRGLGGGGGLGCGANGELESGRLGGGR